jgi:dephospho-CoA kinase
MKRIICIVGMPGAGKSLISDELVAHAFKYVRFGQIVLDKVMESKLKINELNERTVRENIRKEYGIGAFATLNIPKIDKLLRYSDVVVDGLYSWSEYKILKQKYGNRMFIIAVFAPPEVRYKRLKNRKVKNDPENRFRSFSETEAKARDWAEIENIEKGGPIAMADFMIINTGTIKEAREKIVELAKRILNF